MNQNKSNVPVSVAEEPDELSYYRLTLLSFLRESHPDLADDESFVATRSNHAAEAFSAAIRSGLTYDDAAQQANDLLFQGLHFSPLDTLITVLWNEFAADDFMFSPEFGQLYDELTGTVVIWLEENGL